MINRRRQAERLRSADKETYVRHGWFRGHGACFMDGLCGSGIIKERKQRPKLMAEEIPQEVVSLFALPRFEVFHSVF